MNGKRAYLAGVLLGLASLSVGSCSNNSEGERCVLGPGDSANDDCANPLLCKKLKDNKYYCCPVVNSTTTANVCLDQGSGPTPVDAGDAQVTADSAGDSATDSAGDTSLDNDATGPADATSEADATVPEASVSTDVGTEAESSVRDASSDASESSVGDGAPDAAAD